MKKVRIQQHDITDCGAACLASVSAYYSLKIPITRIRQLASTDQNGTNVLGMLEAAEKLHFSCKGVRAEMESLKKIPLPAIAHVVRGNLHHYVVVYKVSEKDITYMDPADGEMITVPLYKFKDEWTGVLIVLVPNDEFKPGNEKMPTFYRLASLVLPYRYILIQSLVGALLFTILGLSTSIYVQKLVDHVLVDGNKNLLNLMSILMVALILFETYLGSVRSIMMLKLGQMIDARLILNFYRHLLRLPTNFFKTMRFGEIISRVNDAVKVRAFVSDVLLQIVTNVLVILFSFLLMFTYYWKLALVVLLIVPFYSLLYYISYKFNKKFQGTYGKAKKPAEAPAKA